MQLLKGANRTLSLILLAVIIPLSAVAERTASVSATYKYILSENDNVTIREAKIKAIEQARAEAIRNEFGTLVASDFISSDRLVNDELSSYYLMDTETSARGEWLGDEQQPEVTMECYDNTLFITAKVRGKAREIVRAKPDIKWQVLKDVDGQKKEADTFSNGERIYVKFSTPADGYVAVYLITSDTETCCLLPYPNDGSGQYRTRSGKEYTFFDKATEPTAKHYKLTTAEPQEYNQLVIIYSPNPFVKCTDVSADARKPNTLTQKDFAKWLLRQQRADKDMVVARKWVQINNIAH